jgi:hypothetical protein
VNDTLKVLVFVLTDRCGDSADVEVVRFPDALANAEQLVYDGVAPLHAKLTLLTFCLGQTQKNEDGTVERPHFLGGQRPNGPSYASPRHGRQLVHHDATCCTQSTLGAGLDGKSEDWRWRGICRQGTHHNRIVGVEPVVLDDDRGTRLADMSCATRDGPDFTTLHSAFQAEIASTNS